MILVQYLLADSDTSAMTVMMLARWLIEIMIDRDCGQ